MHYLVGVGVFECGADLAGEFNYLLEVVRWGLAQVRTIHQLHHKERVAVIFTHIINSHNVWMIQGCGRARFTQKTRTQVITGTSFGRTTSFGSSGGPFTPSPFPLAPFFGSPFPRFPPSPVSGRTAYPLGKNFDSDRAQ